MLAQSVIDQINSDRLNDSSEYISLIAGEITDINQAYLDLVKIADDTNTAKARAILLDQLVRLCNQLSFYIQKIEKSKN